MVNEARIALDRIARGEWKSWRGLPPCQQDDLHAVWPSLQRDSGRSFLGNPPTPALFFTTRDEEPEIRVWMRDDLVIKIDIEIPEHGMTQLEWCDEFGQPSARMDFSFDVVQIQRAQWVFPERGLALFWNSDGDKLVRASVFSCTTVAEYAANLAPWHEPREFLEP